MDRKKIILLVGALLIAALTAFMARSMFVGQTAPKAVAQKPEPSGPKILVATRALPVGTILTADAFRYQPWPKELIESVYFMEMDPNAAKDPKAKAAVGGFPADEDPLKALLGTVVRNPITAGQPITKGSLVAPGDRGFLAAALGPGMRAVTIPVSTLTGVAGFVFPGDRVDLVLTQQVSGAGTGQALKVSETIIRNLRILATDQRTAQSVDARGRTAVSKFKMVTIEVTPRLAEKIAVAQTIGSLSLSLRSLADNAAELEQALARGDVNLPAGATPEEEEKILASVQKQPTSGASTYATGGDVSRFQRSSLPPITPRQVATEAVKLGKDLEKISKGPVVRVTRGGGAIEEVQVGRR
ncbi:Flp pilus assembly protein CpaB [Sphingorhabdus sp.]|jgi:pilus assembly protein CpaB|uniref:Flp pilus assembly protein CpaB n=1 Tax=Sphingorhabdus sp. TaxID=1902408 RepID=UPI003BB13160|nr:Flp pilus assembly protein CpaB [Sphingomonadales bacterium]MBK9433296.1 Flp pilus assembly protein CpaB [Sphingomonadales bacterium]MBL0020855.1 Flp pilus assembly protein CpaB [Sphingomonadales bacterium]